jgi:hypothetical protein
VLKNHWDQKEATVEQTGFDRFVQLHVARNFLHQIEAIEHNPLAVTKEMNFRKRGFTGFPVSSVLGLSSAFII